MTLANVVSASLLGTKVLEKGGALSALRRFAEALHGAGG
jgi:hypothetical protein